MQYHLILIAIISYFHSTGQANDMWNQLSNSIFCIPNKQRDLISNYQTLAEEGLVFVCLTNFILFYIAIFALQSSLSLIPFRLGLTHRLLKLIATMHLATFLVGTFCQTNSALSVFRLANIQFFILFYSSKITT